MAYQDFLNLFNLSNRLFVPSKPQINYNYKVKLAKTKLIILKNQIIYDIIFIKFYNLFWVQYIIYYNDYIYSYLLNQALKFIRTISKYHLLFESKNTKNTKKNRSFFIILL